MSARLDYEAIADDLKKRYFDIVLKENGPFTPDITKELDRIEDAIEKLEDGTAFGS